MNCLNNKLNQIMAPLSFLSAWLIRIGLGTAFIIHAYSKFPLPPEKLMTYFGFSEWLASFVALSELLAGVLIILGGFFNNAWGSILTRFAALMFVVIMIFAFGIAHQDWFITAKLFTSEQAFLFLIGCYFLIKGNEK